MKKMKPFSFWCIASMLFAGYVYEGFFMYNWLEANVLSVLCFDFLYSRFVLQKI